MDDFPRNSEAWKILRQIQADEAQLRAHRQAAREVRHAYSHATGKFYDKAVAVKGRGALEFLVRIEVGR